MATYLKESRATPFSVYARLRIKYLVVSVYVCKSRWRVGARSASTAPTGRGSGPPGGRRRARTRVECFFLFDFCLTFVFCAQSRTRHGGL